MNPPDNCWPLFPKAIGSSAEAAHKAHDSRLTKREQIAAMAMQGMLCSENPDFAPAARDIAATHSISRESVLAHFAVRYADALLAELAKPQEGGAS